MGISVLQHAANKQAAFNRMMKESNGYEAFTTFYSDLTIADVFGISAIKQTYNNVVKEWISNYKYFTEFIMSLNAKAWEWNDAGDIEKSQLYSDLYYKARDLAYDKFSDEEKQYLFEITD